LVAKRAIIFMNFYCVNNQRITTDVRTDEFINLTTPIIRIINYYIDPEKAYAFSRARKGG